MIGTAQPKFEAVEQYSKSETYPSVEKTHGGEEKCLRKRLMLVACLAETHLIAQFCRQAPCVNPRKNTGKEQLKQE